MLMERFAEESKPPVCGQPVGDQGITRRPDPHRVIWMDRNGVAAVMPFPGWDAVFGFIMRDGVSALRDGTLLILTPLHWTAAQWGHS